MLSIDTLVFQSRPEVERAAQAARTGRGSFPDPLIRELNATAGCTTTMTFDRKAARMDGFSLLR